MNVYKTENIRNTVLLGHGGSGKTTLAEAMALSTGVITRMGNINDGNTISDFDKEEQKRKFSISSTVIPVEYNNVKVNILDTPGYFDFIGATEEGLSVADSAVIVINAKSGVEVGAHKAWRFCETFKIPRTIYVSGMDDANADFGGVIDALKGEFGNKIAPFQFPIKNGNELVGYVDVLSGKAFKFKADGTIEPSDVPSDIADKASGFKDAMMESVAETSEELMEKYFGGEEFTDDEIATALKSGIKDGDVVPVLCGVSVKNLGPRGVLETICKYFPAPNNSPVVKKGKNTKDDSEFICDVNPDKPLAAYVFKTIVDPFIGKYSLVKVFSGLLKGDDTVFNGATDESEKISKLYVMRGKNVEEVSELAAGDIGAIGKLDLAKTGDTLSRKDAPIVLDKFVMSKPYTYMKYNAVNKGEEDKIQQALQKLCAEDQTLKVVADEENKQSLIYGIGDQQLDVVVSKMKDKYKVEVALEKPAFAFRETIRKTSDVQGKHKKQSGGHGQYGDVRMRFEPLGDTSKAYEFTEEVVGGSVPKNYFPAVEKGLQECVQRGPLANYPVVGVKAVLYDGSYHPVDSNEMSFKMATILAFKKGFMEAGPVLLEPISSLKVTVPDRFTGDVMGDLNKRRGRVLGSNPVDGGRTCIEADIPQSELFGYGTTLRSMTGGFGDYEYEFSRYEQAPSDVQEREVAARHTDSEE